MSGRALFRNPTWSGLLPGLPSFEPAPAELASAVQKAVGQAGSVLLARLGDGAPTCVRLQPEAGTPLFLKIVPKSRAASLDQAERLTSWLAGQGLRVNACLPGYPRPFGNSSVVCAYPYQEGRRPRPERRDLETLGAALARLHLTLAGCPERARLDAATDERFRMLDAARDELVRGRPAGPEPQALQALARDRDLVFHGRVAGSTPIHDDLNPGNLLMTGPDEEPLFLDFEDALHGVLPALYDLVVVIERLVLVQETDDGEATRLGMGFLAAYRAAGGRLEPRDSDALAACMRGRALRASCTLALCEWDGIPVERAEWDKFGLLLNLCKERRHVLRAIWTGAA